MQPVFIINPTAGKLDASVALIPQIHAAASRAGVKPIVEITRRPGHACDLAAKYAASGEEVALYACGGDGTLNEVCLLYTSTRSRRKRRPRASNHPAASVNIE